MAYFKVNATGELIERSERYVSVFPEHLYTFMGSESPDEVKARERLEALKNKVDIEDDSEEDFEGLLDAVSEEDDSEEERE